MNGLDLFSGIGGITKALEGYVTPVAYCERDKYCQGVLLSQMWRGELPEAPIWDDITTLQPIDLPIKPDIIYGGFPCQDISVAGRGEGLEGKRSGLFFEIVRLVSEIRPKFVFLENVSAITGRGLGRIVGEFFEIGYDCRWEVIRASDIGAPHERKRWFALAYTNGQGLEGYWENRKTGGAYRRRKTAVIASDYSKTLWGDPVTKILRMDDGVSPRMERIKCLGNAVVSVQAREAFERLMGLK